MKLTAVKQSELYKHINIDESKVCVATVEEERPIRKVITSEINGHRSPNVKMRKRACVHAGLLYSISKPTCFLHRTPIDSICRCFAAMLPQNLSRAITNHPTHNNSASGT